MSPFLKQLFHLTALVAASSPLSSLGFATSNTTSSGDPCNYLDVTLFRDLHHYCPLDRILRGILAIEPDACLYAY